MNEFQLSILCTLEVEPAGAFPSEAASNRITLSLTEPRAYGRLWPPAILATGSPKTPADQI